MDQLDEIRQKIDIVDLVSQYVPLKPAGRNHKANCPFHAENTPSFMVSPERQIFKCFGCSSGGDIFKFLMLIEGLEFGEAVRKLAERAGVKLEKYRSSPEEEKKKKFFEINHLALEYYHYLLTSHPAGKKALDYTLGRGITRESIDRFKIGYAPSMWDGVQKFLVGKKKYQAEFIEKAGLILPNNRGGYYDRFRDRLIFPLRYYQDNVCGFAGRLIPPAPEDQAKYINSPETPVYQKSRLLYDLSVTRGAIRKQDQAVVVEGELDMISSFQAGIENVVAIKGSALTEDQLILLKRYTKNLVLALDADFAGNKAAQRGIELADKQGFSIKVVSVKGSKDPDEAAQKDPAGWLAQVKKAVSVYDYLFEFAFTNFDERLAEGKRQIGGFLTPILAKITDRIMRGHYIALLADRLEVGEEAIITEVERAQQRLERGRDEAESSFQSVRQTRREVLEEYLMALCLQGEVWEWFAKKNHQKLLLNPVHQKIAQAVGEYLKKRKNKKVQALTKKIPAEASEIFDNLYLRDLGAVVEADRVVEEVEKTAAQIERLDLKKQLARIGREMKLIEQGKGERKKLTRLNQEFRDLSAKLV